MKSDSKALTWGIVVGVGLAIVVWVLAVKFPNLHIPFSGKQVDTFLVSAFLFGVVIAGYRPLWKFPGFWGLLLVFFAGHVALYRLVVMNIIEHIGGFRLNILYGVVSAMEFVVFAVIVARLYHRGPDTRFLTGTKTHQGPRAS
jgi:hypothetical protein